jgi:hypothetical protein
MRQGHRDHAGVVVAHKKGHTGNALIGDFGNQPHEQQGKESNPDH